MKVSDVPDEQSAAVAPALGGETMTRIRQRISAVALMAFVLALGALPAFATPGPGETAVNSAVSDGAATATSVVTENIPVILGVAVLWVALNFGKKLLGKLG